MTIDQSVFEENIPTSTVYYGLSLNYDNLVITNTEITGVRPIRVSQGAAGRTSKYGHNVTINGLHNVTGIDGYYPIVSPTNYEELVLVSNEINNEYTGKENVYIYLAGTEYIETEPIVFDDIPCSVELRGNGKTIDADGKQFLTLGEGKKLIIRNITIANAKAEKGAAIINHGTLTTQNNVNFKNNEALYYGGAIYNTGNLSLSTTNFTNNKVTTISDATLNDYGGAAVCSLGKLTVQRSNFVENLAAYDVTSGNDGGCGGAINILNTTQDVSITNSNFTKNGAGYGGAISIDNNDNENTKKVTISNNKFDENTALFGGAINTYQQMNITNCNFENNDGNGYGDLAYALNDIKITGSTITTDNLEELIGGTGNIIATNNIVNEETLPERLIKTTLTITPKNTLALNEYNLITATLIDATNVVVANKEVNVIIDGEKVDSNITDSNGVVSYYYKPTEGTSATIQFTFTPEDYYIASESEEIEVDLIVRDETVIEYVIVNDVEGKVVIDIRVYEKETEDLIVNAKVDLSGDVTATNIRTNKLYKNTELEAGEHTITVTYNGLEDYYKPSTTDITFTVIEDPSKIIEDLKEQLAEANEKIDNLTENLTAATDRIAELEANVSDLSGALDEANGKIGQLESELINANLKIAELEGNISDLSDALDVANGKIGELETDLTEANNRIDELEKLIAQLHAPEGTQITIDPVVGAKYRDNITISGLLTTNDGVALHNKNVTITVNGVSENVTTDTGKFEYVLSAKIVGDNEVTVTYAGDNKYNSSESSSTFVVDRKESTISIDDIDTVTCNDNVTITGVITSIDGIALRHVNLKIYLNGEEQAVLTDHAGKFRAKFTTNAVGEQLVEVVYRGNTKYLGSKANTTFTTTSVKLVMYTVKPVTYRDNYTVQGKLTDAKGNIITGAEVQLTINGETVTLTTDKNGKYTYKARALALGEFTVTASYVDEATGTELTATKTLEVTKRAVTLLVDEISNVAVGEEVTITGKLTDDIDTPYKNCNIYVEINGEVQHIKTDTKGIFTCTYTPVSAGTQNVTITYKGSTNYLGDKVTSTFEATA